MPDLNRATLGALTGVFALGTALSAAPARTEDHYVPWVAPLTYGCNHFGYANLLAERLVLREWPEIRAFFASPEFLATVGYSRLTAYEILRIVTPEPDPSTEESLPSVTLPPPPPERPSSLRAGSAGGVYSIEILDSHGVPTLTLRGARDTGLDAYTGEIIAPGIMHMRGYVRASDGFAIGGTQDIEIYRFILSEGGPTLVALASPSFRINDSGLGTAGSVATGTGLGLEVPVERAPGPLRFSLVGGPEAVIRSGAVNPSGVIAIHAGGIF